MQPPTPEQWPLLLSLAVWCILGLSGYRNLLKTLRPHPLDSSSPPGVDIFIPARNEEEVIEASVCAVLCEQSPGNLVVVDDQSSDKTPEILAGIVSEAPDALEIVHGTGPGPGQCGKPAALLRAFQTHPGERDWLLFLDADVVLAPGALAALVATAEAQGADMLTALPHQVMSSPLEKIVMPSVGSLILTRYPQTKVADPKRALAFANGQLILVKREFYQQLGGHQAVISEVLEDVRLAEKLKAIGARLQVIDGRFLAQTRMYSGWAELKEGWGKNLYLLMGQKLSETLFWIVLVLFMAWSGPLFALLAGGGVGITGYLTILGIQMFLRAKGGAAPGWAVLAPLGALLTAYLLAHSAHRHLSSKRVSWKGRNYQQDS